MAKNKIERIDQEIAKTREKIAEQQEKLKDLEAQKTEAENLEIVQMVRALHMTPAQLSAMLSGGMVPGRAAAPRLGPPSRADSPPRAIPRPALHAPDRVEALRRMEQDAFRREGTSSPLPLPFAAGEVFFAPSLSP